MSTILQQAAHDWQLMETVYDPVGELIIVLSGQFEMTDLPFNGWWDIWCVEDESHHETFKGTISEFAEKLERLGWAADSLERYTAICKACSNAPDPFTYTAQYQDEEVL